jgi:subtilisin-like proprotein convertase family protein
MIGNVLHDNVSDLEFTLTHGGISDTLIYQVNGNGGVNFTNTYLNDNLGISFDVASAPFAGIFIPYNSLTNFTSTSLPGEWILTITDHKSGDDGVLQDWGLLISESTIVGIEEKNDFLIPNSISLFQNYPNPFNPCTIISYQLAVSSKVILKVYDILGNEVATLVNEEKPAGNYEIEFEATNLSSGLYFYQLKSGEFVQTKKMILIK